MQQLLYEERFGAENFELLKDSSKTEKLNLKQKCFIQITSVRPYFDAEDLARRSLGFQRNSNLSACVVLMVLASVVVAVIRFSQLRQS